MNYDCKQCLSADKEIVQLKEQAIISRSVAVGREEYIRDLRGKYVTFSGPKTKQEIADRLELLATEIEDIATSLDYFGGFPDWARHGKEMVGASKLCREWSAAILAESVSDLEQPEQASP